MNQTFRVEEVGDLPPAEPNMQDVDLLSVGHRTFLTYRVNPFTVDPRQGQALVKFVRCMQFQGGAPNDEALHNHPLFAHGLRPYAIHRVTNSPWAAERLRIADRVGRVNPERLAEMTHYVCAFKEGTFECLAHAHALIGMFPSRKAAFLQALELCGPEMD